MMSEATCCMPSRDDRSRDGSVYLAHAGYLAVPVIWVVPASGPMAGSAGGGRRVRARRGARCALLPRDREAAAFAARARAPPFRRAGRLGLGRTRIRLVPVDRP